MISSTGGYAIKILPMSFLIIIMVSLSHAMAQEFKNITAEELKQLIDQNEKMTVVDARTVGEYQDGHIPSAMNIPPEEFNEISRSQNPPPNRDIPVY
jgi:phage shock protein E